MKLRYLLLSIIFLFIFGMGVNAEPAEGVIKTESDKITLLAAIERISQEYEVYFTFDMTLVSDVEVEYENLSHSSAEEAISYILKGTNLKYKFYDRRFVILYKEDEEGLESLRQMSRHLDGLISEGERTITSAPKREIRAVPRLSSRFISKEIQRVTFTVEGKVIDQDGEALIGVNIQVKGSNKGTATDFDGNFILEDIDDNAILVISYIGYQTQEIAVSGRSELTITLASDAQLLDEVVVVGYGTQKKSDLTGSVTKINFENYNNRPNSSLVESLKGVSAGLNISQIDRAGASPSIRIRGRTSISGEQSPLLILDGVIFRGSLIDINPNDIKNIEILKDNSASAVYGSQAANGVIIITSKSGEGLGGKPTVTYSINHAFQKPTKELIPGNGDEFITKNININWKESRIVESGYLVENEDYSVYSTFKTNEQLENYLAGNETNWYNLLTNENMFYQNHDINLSNRTENMNYLISFGFTNQKGYMINERYRRYNGRINTENKINDWLTMGLQSFFSLSDNSGSSPSPSDRYIMPFEAAYQDNGELNLLIEGRSVSPLVISQSEDFDKRYNLFGNFYGIVEFPFLKGLKYKINMGNNYRTGRNYYFQLYSNNFQGEGRKSYNNTYDFSVDNLLTYNRVVNNLHNINATLLYGIEERKNDATDAISSIFIDPILGYNRLQSGNSELQKTNSGAWEERSLYSMARLFYSYKNRYLITGTIRRDGFSGFSEANKFGIFPSAAFGWIISEENFFRSEFLDFLKVRLSYGKIGNRTIGRYNTLAKISGDFGYVNSLGESIYTKSINSLASPNLKWESTTGINLGLDFEFLNSRIEGQIEYYNNNTMDLLYNVDIPSIGRFSNFPDNLGKIHNHGIEISIASDNIKKKDFLWNSEINFTRNRDVLKELLGFDNDGDGIEDDLISEGLFIGHPLSVVYHYQVTGDLYQIGDEIPSWGDVGSQVIIDQNNDGKIDPENDKVILGYTQPSYSFSVINNFSYKNWSLSFLINSVQGGKNYYYARDNLHYQSLGSGFSNSEGGEQHEQLNFPTALDYWLPENPNAKYPAIGTSISKDLLSTSWIQRNFVRLQDLSIHYSFKPTFLESYNFGRLNFYMGGQNLITITKWPGWDPETGEGISRNGRPVLRSFTIGANIQF